eukprot:GFYU01006018.1.p1 GENE.GFYU01006018.1~~GFYU01006018.1.p1  ORF type:complete len:237 (-),score=41.40 GFYU01006018.1:75-752(-)
MDHSNEKDYHVMFKVCLLGDPHVGKSTFFRCLFNESTTTKTNYRSSSESNLGINLKTRLFEEQDAVYAVQFWDTPGAERHLKLTSRYSAGCAGAVFMFDLCSPDSLDHVEDWVKEVEKSGPVCKILVGNKADSDGKRQVSEQEATEYANKFDMQYFETSASSASNVLEAVSALVSDVIATIPYDPDPALLLRRGMKIGRLLTDNPRYRQSLYMELPNTSETLDWM